MANLLLIDEKPDFVEPLKRELAKKRQDLEAVIAPNGQRALEVLDTEPISIVVVSAALPGPIDANQILLTCAARNPHVHFIVSDPTAADAWLPSPTGTIHSVGESTDLGPAVDVISNYASSKEGFQGKVSEIGAEDVIWYVSLSRRDARLHMRNTTTTGRLYFRAGRLVNATFGNVRGFDAVVEILAETNGALVVEWPAPDVEITIRDEPMALLARALPKAAELREERGKQAELVAVELEEIDDGPGTQVPQLFSEEELAEMSFDDTLAGAVISPSRSGKGLPMAGGGPPPIPGGLPGPGIVPAAVALRGVAPVATAGPAYDLEPYVTTSQTLDEELDRFFSMIAERVDDVSAAALFNIVDGTIIGSGGADMDAGPAVPQFVNAIRALVFGLEPAASRVVVREMVVHGNGAHHFVLVGVPDAEVAALVVQRKTSNPSFARAHLRHHVRGFTQFLGDHA